MLSEASEAIMRDRAFVREMIERAIAAHCSELDEGPPIGAVAAELWREAAWVLAACLIRWN
jgi:hypothetical protein